MDRKTTSANIVVEPSEIFLTARTHFPASQVLTVGGSDEAAGTVGKGVASWVLTSGDGWLTFSPSDNPVGTRIRGTGRREVRLFAQMNPGLEPRATHIYLGNRATGRVVCTVRQAGFAD
jgi:hypothetical protein